MPRQVRMYRCLIISPSDVEPERDAVDSVLRLWNTHVGKGLGVHVEPVRWESHARPDLSDEAQAAINRQLVDECDFGIAIFWSRLGTPTAKHRSGSVEEIERLIGLNRKVMLYFSEREVPRDALSDAQPAELAEIRRHYQARGLVGTFTTAEDLRERVNLHMSNLVAELRAGTQEAQPPEAPKPEIRVRVECVPGGRQGLLYYVRVENHAPQAVFLGHLELVTPQLSTYPCKPIVPSRLEPGDSRSFRIDPALHGWTPYMAVLVDKIGRRYETTGDAFKVAHFEWATRYATSYA